MICTAAASVSSRRLRSWPPSPAASARRRRSQTSSAVRPSWPSSAASCSACAMCRRSVSSRSPPTRLSTRGCSCSSRDTASNIAATPRSSSTAPHTRSLRARSSANASPWASRPAASSPTKQVSAARRTRVVRCGCSSASSSRCHSAAAGVANTEVFPVRTTGTPAPCSPACTSAAWVLVRTSTAMSLGSTGRGAEPSRGVSTAPPESRATTRPARSATTAARAGPVRRVPFCATGRLPSRSSTRSCNGAAASTSRPTCLAATGSTRMRSSPSAAPPKHGGHPVEQARRRCDGWSAACAPPTPPREPRGRRARRRRGSRRSPASGRR